MWPNLLATIEKLRAVSATGGDTKFSCDLIEQLRHYFIEPAFDEHDPFLRLVNLRVFENTVWLFISRVSIATYIDPRYKRNAHRIGAGLAEKMSLASIKRALHNTFMQLFEVL